MCDDDEVCSTVTKEAVKNFQTPFQSKERTASNQEHEAYRYLQRMKPDNYVREDDDDDLSVGQMGYYLPPVFFSEAFPPPMHDL